MFILNIFKTNWHKRLSESTTSDLSNKNITDEQAKDLAAALKANRSLTSLSLWNNQIGDAGTRDLATSLSDNKSLMSLYLPWNNIGEATFKIINEYLYRNKTITEKKQKRNMKNSKSKN